jgi:hypothetical protein
LTQQHLAGINECLMYSNNPFETVYGSRLWQPNFKVID